MWPQAVVPKSWGGAGELLKIEDFVYPTNLLNQDFS